MRLLVAILSLVLMSFATHANESSIYTQDAITARNQIRNSTGRIISISRGLNYLKIVSTCSATLVRDQETIISAGHCFKTSEVLTSRQKLNKITKKITTTEKQYFDIDGITSQHLSTSIRNLMDEDGVIRGRHVKTALGFLKNLPEIKKYTLHPEYKKNIKIDLDTFITRNISDLNKFNYLEENHSAQSLLYDIALAKLSKKINSPAIEIAEYNYGEDIFVGGYAGGPLDSYFEVYKCMTGDIAYDVHLYSLEKLLSEFQVVLNNLGTMYGQVSDTNKMYESKKRITESTIQLIKKTKEEGIVSECPGGMIIPGFSGGPQFVVKNGKPLLLGISSTVPQSSIKHGELMLGAKAIHSKDIK